jgi:hypothetical protein
MCRRTKNNAFSKHSTFPNSAQDTWIAFSTQEKPQGTGEWSKKKYAYFISQKGIKRALADEDIAIPFAR